MSKQLNIPCCLFFKTGLGRNWPRCLAILALSAGFAHNVFHTYLKWGDVVFDSGVDWDIALKLCAGKRLYTDIPYCFGPLAPWINALLFQSFGVHTNVLAAAGLVCTALTCMIVYRLARCFIHRLGGVCVTLAFLYICAFGHLTPNGSFNFVIPYTTSATYGMLASLASILFLVRFAQKDSARDLARVSSTIVPALCGIAYCSAGVPPATGHLAGGTPALRSLVLSLFFLFLVALTKIELLAALSITHLMTMMALAWLGKLRLKLISIAFVSTWAAITFTYGLLYLRVGPQLFSANLFLLINPAYSRFTAEGMGFQDLNQSLWAALHSTFAMLSAILCALVCAVIESMLANGRWGGHFVRRSPSSGTPFSHNLSLDVPPATLARRGSIAALLSAASLLACATLYVELSVDLSFRMLPLLALVVLGALAWAAFRDHRNGTTTTLGSQHPRLLAHGVLWIFSLACLMRMPLRTVAYHYGFFLLVPSLISLGVFWFSYLPRWLSSLMDSRTTWLLNFCGIGVFAGLTIAHAGVSHSAYARRTQLIDTPYSKFYVLRDNNGIPTAGRCLAETVRLLGKLPAKSRVLFIPQGVGLGFCAGLMNQYRCENYIQPAMTGPYDDNHLLEMLKAEPPDLIVRLSFAMDSFGVFGEDYANHTWSWILENYDPCVSLGSANYVLMLKPRNAPYPFPELPPELRAQ